MYSRKVRRRCYTVSVAREERAVVVYRLPDSLPHPTVDADGWQAQLESLYAISVEIAGLRELSQVMDRALEYCLALTTSAFGFIGLVDGPDTMDVAAIRGFVPDRPGFYERFRKIPIRRTIFGVVILEGRSNLSNDVLNDPLHIGSPRGHPPVRTFLGVPLKVRDETIGMIGVANRPDGYDAGHERLLSTFANQVAVAIANARLYEQQRQMIADLQSLHARLNAAQVEALIHQERNRIAEELHDRVAQIIFSIGIEATWCLERDGVPPELAASPGARSGGDRPADRGGGAGQRAAARGGRSRDRELAVQPEGGDAGGAGQRPGYPGKPTRVDAAPAGSPGPALDAAAGGGARRAAPPAERRGRWRGSPCRDPG